ncbi:hypothetical protein ASG87_10440 [Frateuria sp. Soil773]|uniref:DUF2845 domain-containing protein n=1 Tax=Frateuria sp. Soil773 TaxID=1736407 RepID=UPI0006F6211A|nr:DUF2845 domain-containing protein [Frateuria sp. Soil773]KRF01915.1 hypothetical protein ASG87_10440 [Frateuria sp. Soil773]
MRRYPLAIALLGLSLAAQAGNTLRVGNQVLTVGDSATHALELLGTPAYKEPLENAYGAYRGERWQYPRGRRVVTLTIVAGKVGEIEDRVR